MYVGSMAERFPDREAVIMAGSRQGRTYAQLDGRSNQVARALRRMKLETGDGIAILLENTPEFFEIWWAALRSGLYVTPINWHLTADEVSYLLQDSAAKVVFVSPALTDVLDRARGGRPEPVAVVVGGHPAAAGDLDYEELVAAESDSRLDHELAGGTMFYSSGTTGRPKGIKAPLSGGGPDDGSSVMRITAVNFDVREGMRFLSTGPLYHAAPILWSAGMHTVGSTVIVMESFDAAASLRAIDDLDVSVSQWVPTMFHRLLRLPEEIKSSYRGHTHEIAWHAAAPCPIDVKREMIDWWGPIIWEYYSGSEGGGTKISADEWLERPGSVGRHWRGGVTHVLDLDTYQELPPGEKGLIFFDVLPTYRFAYHDSPEKTREAYYGDLITLGDIGYVDDDGYLYLTDRRSNTIVSGGVNIYPREIEEVLSRHPQVTDAAVFGIPDEEFGERVMAVIQPVDPEQAPALLEAELRQYCRVHLAGFKCPREFSFRSELPRDPNGKLYKRRLREPYWEGRRSRII